jgi:hypothetical protein
MICIGGKDDTELSLNKPPPLDLPVIDYVDMYMDEKILIIYREKKQEWACQFLMMIIATMILLCPSRIEPEGRKSR